MLLKLHEETPQKRLISSVLEGLARGGIYIVPTDTVYAIICSLNAAASIGELYKIKGISENQPLSLLCRDVAMASLYARSISDPVFRFMRSATPGPYTFIFSANRKVDRRGTGKRKEVGIRIVDHPLHRALMEQLDMPLISTSITQSEQDYTDPEELHNLYGHRVKGVVDGGIRYHVYSTVLDCQDDEVKLLRQGEGSLADCGLPLAEE